MLPDSTLQRRFGACMALQIAPWYAAMLALIYAALSARVIQGGGKYSVDLHLGSVDDLRRRMRSMQDLPNTSLYSTTVLNVNL